MFIKAKDDGGGGDNWSYKSCKAPVKSSSPTKQHPVFYRPDALPVAQPTVSKALKGKYYRPGSLRNLNSSWHLFVSELKSSVRFVKVEGERFSRIVFVMPTADSNLLA